MTMTTDLQGHIGNKLRLWIKDSFELFAMADLRSEGIPSIVHCLFVSLATALVTMKASDEDAMELFRMYLAKARPMRSRR